VEQCCATCLSPKALDGVGVAALGEPGRTGTAIHNIYVTQPPQQATAQLIRFVPGLMGTLHEHLGYELMFVLQGELRNDNAIGYTVGIWSSKSRESVHRISTRPAAPCSGIREAPRRAEALTAGGPRSTRPHGHPSPILGRGLPPRPNPLSTIGR